MTEKKKKQDLEPTYAERHGAPASAEAVLEALSQQAARLAKERETLYSKIEELGDEHEAIRKTLLASMGFGPSERVAASSFRASRDGSERGSGGPVSGQDTVDSYGEGEQGEEEQTDEPVADNGDDTGGTGSSSGGAPGDPEDRPVGSAADPVFVQLNRTSEGDTDDGRLWRVIRDRVDAISFNRYQDFMDCVLCNPAERLGGVYGQNRIADLQARLSSTDLPLRGRDAYELIRLATEAFLLQEAGLKGGMDVAPSDEGRANERRMRERRQQYHCELKEILVEGKVLPYFDLIQRALREIPIKSEGILPLGSGAGSYGIVPANIQNPTLIELIWSYWHEEAGIIQTMNAISLRFQNRRNSNVRNPLERIAIDPLRPLNNMLWGFIESEPHRVTLTRRAHEYEHEYGLTLVGKAVRDLKPIDRRTQFIKAFHTLLNLASRFFRDDDDATIFADGFPLLNSLREVHLILSQGAHNQYGDLPWSSRSEILIQMWLLARPEMREFLGGRVMVPYEEPWMGQVETMRDLQNWGTAPVAHFRDLAVFGEPILLSIRFTSWASIKQREAAVSWAKFWRNEIQSYLHSYRALTGVDLTADRVDFTLPSKLLEQPAELLERKVKGLG